MFLCNNKNAELIAKEAESRGIGVTSFPELSKVIIRFTKGSHREFIAESGTDLLGVATYKIFVNKALTDNLLREGGFPVPDEVVTDDIMEAESFLRGQEKVVVKPLNLTWGKGVTTNITTSEQLEEAFKMARSQLHGARAASEKVMCQQQIEGEEYRVLVVNQKEVFAAQRIPAHVLGDGQATVAELIERLNSDAPDSRKIIIESQMVGILKNQGVQPEAVPHEGRRIWLRQVANAHAGGTVFDATDSLGEEARKKAIEVAKYFNVPVVGIDCITFDLNKSLGCIIELNGTPDITLHHNPTQGESRDVAKAIVDMLFPETVDCIDGEEK